MTLPRVVQVTAAAGRVLSEVVAVARRDGLVAQSYWLATTLALGARLKLHDHARPAQDHNSWVPKSGSHRHWAPGSLFEVLPVG